MIVTRVFVFVRNINYSLLLPFPSSSAYGMGTVPFADNFAPLVFIPRVIITEQSLYLEVVSGMSHLHSRRDFGYGGRGHFSGIRDLLSGTDMLLATTKQSPSRYQNNYITTWWHYLYTACLYGQVSHFVSFYYAAIEWQIMLSLLSIKHRQESFQHTTRILR